MTAPLYAGVECVVCGERFVRLPRTRRCHGCAHQRTPSALIDSITPYEGDARCQYVVQCHPDGLTLEEIGDLLGLTRERIRQIEHRALLNFRRRALLAGIREEDVLEMLEGKGS